MKNIFKNFDNCTFTGLDQCTVGLWGGQLNDTSYQASVNMVVDEDTIYHVKDFWNGEGSINAISSAQIVGCTNRVVKLMDAGGKKRCELTTGEYPDPEFSNLCGNDVVTQYIIGSKIF